jgi:hypothetical protein
MGSGTSAGNAIGYFAGQHRNNRGQSIVLYPVDLSSEQMGPPIGGEAKADGSAVKKTIFLTNDSLVPAFVFYRQCQSVLETCLHQTSIGINHAYGVIKLFFDNQRASFAPP